MLIKEGLQDPRAIVLDPYHGYLYWTDWGSEPHIGKVSARGCGRLVALIYPQFEKGEMLIAVKVIQNPG